MPDRHPVQLPGSSLPYFRTARFVHYVRELIRQSVLLSVAGYFCLLVLVLTVGEDSGSPVAWIVSGSFCGLAFLLAWPQLLLLYRILWGMSGNRGILFAKSATDRWRAQWQAIAEASLDVQRKCRRQRQLFMLPSMRPDHWLEDDEAGDYSRPEDVLADLPDTPAFVTFGHLTDQPLQVIDAGSADRAAKLVRHMAALVAGRLLGREIPFITFQREWEGGIRMTFLTTVEAGLDHRAYLWTTVQLAVSGTTVGGYVETVRTYYFGRGECRGGYWHRGDEARVKGYGELAVEVLTLVTPLGVVLIRDLLQTAYLELFRRHASGRFYLYYPPEAGDTVELLLIGENGSDLVADNTFAARVEGVRNDILQEIHKVTGIFAGVLNEV